MGKCVDEPKLQFRYPEDSESFKQCPRASVSSFGWKWLKLYNIWEMRNFNFDIMQLSEAEIDLIFLYKSSLAEFTKEKQANGKK